MKMICIILSYIIYKYVIKDHHHYYPSLHFVSHQIPQTSQISFSNSAPYPSSSPKRHSRNTRRPNKQNSFLHKVERNIVTNLLSDLRNTFENEFPEADKNISFLWGKKLNYLFCIPEFLFLFQH